MFAGVDCGIGCAFSRPGRYLEEYSRFAQGLHPRGHDGSPGRDHRRQGNSAARGLARVRRSASSRVGADRYAGVGGLP